MKTSGETLLSLINEMLDFSKIEAGKLELEARPFWLATLVEETVELLAPRAQDKGLEIASFVDERVPARVTGDATRLRQVLLNLAGNAVKFTEQGGLAVIVEPGTPADADHVHGARHRHRHRAGRRRRASSASSSRPTAARRAGSAARAWASRSPSASSSAWAAASRVDQPARRRLDLPLHRAAPAARDGGRQPSRRRNLAGRRC